MFFNIVNVKRSMLSVICAIFCVSVSAAELPPLKLMSPLSNVSLEALAGEADSAYANKQLKAAEVGFRSILELDHGNRRAMFRLGNIYQQQGSNEQAISFYRQAAQSTEFSQQLDEFGEKALINIALLAAEQLKQALSELEKRKPSSKNMTTTQNLVDDLTDSQALIAMRIAKLQNETQTRETQTRETQNRKPALMSDLVAPEVISGNVKSALKIQVQAPPRVTYSKQADPLDDAPEVTYVKGAPSKVAKPTAPMRKLKRTSSPDQTL